MACPSNDQNYFLSVLSFVQTWHAAHWDVKGITSFVYHRINWKWNNIETSRMKLALIYLRYLRSSTGNERRRKFFNHLFFFTMLFQLLRYPLTIYNRSFFFIVPWEDSANESRTLLMDTPLWINVPLWRSAGRFCLTSVDRYLRVHGENFVRNAKLQAFCELLRKKEYYQNLWEFLPRMYIFTLNIIMIKLLFLLFYNRNQWYQWYLTFHLMYIQDTIKYTKFYYSQKVKWSKEFNFKLQTLHFKSLTLSS